LPFGVKDQDNYYNCALEIKTDYEPKDLLMILKTVEKEVGRKESFTWGPREIDLDLALFDKLVIRNESLKIPHPGIRERDFFLVPLLELDDGLQLPDDNKKLKDYLKLIDSNHIIEKYEFHLDLKRSEL
jgi:2-amino-4-hydroxy-6-hydroxymethyldihydropteridine diphosphokinase